MFLPSSERYSTVACAPTESLPSTFVSPSMKNCTVFTFWSFITSTAKAASPTDEIFPATDWASGRAPGEAVPVYAGIGIDQAATVKQTRNRLAINTAVRNRIEFSSNSISTGFLFQGTKCAKTAISLKLLVKAYKNQRDTRKLHGTELPLLVLVL